MSTLPITPVESKESFRLFPTIVMIILFMAFFASNVYVLIASWE